jgi:hypothetical protein
LPAEATVRRTYCSQACRKRAARARQAAQRRELLAATVISDVAAAWFTALEANWRDRVDAWAHCPGCGVVVWAGVRRRRDAVYCSPKCRLRVWRARAEDSV